MNENTNAKNNDINLKSDESKYIELNVFVKKIGLASTGGQAKTIIRSENLLLNSNVETRNKKKLYNNDIVEYEGKKYIVKL
jgi:ribosome-associated protein